MTGFRTRFAPSPTGFLHLGHVISAFYARDMARPQGQFIIRIEDIDRQRCLPRFEKALHDDLDWLGLCSDEPVLRQSDSLPFYLRALDELRAKHLIYPCTCSRTRIREEATGYAPDGSLIYSGQCRYKDIDLSQPHVWRLDMEKALHVIGHMPGWREYDGGSVAGKADVFGDVVLGRKDNGVSYHLCVTCDDARQSISLVTRGQDLFEATSIHRVLQELFGYPEPLYAHHPLLCDEAGKKLSKRDGADGVRLLRDAGFTPADVYTLAKEHLDTSKIIPVGRYVDR